MEKQEKDNFRPPIVTLMGHVDHGKTTLLDAIRKTNIVGREHGGITQHIGAYQITFQDKPITFVDTPGHAAFEKMRSRGAEVADIVILVVAATEGVKPQTVEAIKHAQNANKPAIVAFTKTDLPNINLEKVKKELEREGIIVESFGGKVPTVEVSAPKGKGIEDLLEMILLLWQLSPQQSLPDAPLEAVVVESFLDKNRGSVNTVIIKEGTLKLGQKIKKDNETITVKALIDDRGKNIPQAEPGKPVEVLGFKKVLEVGSIVHDLTITKTHESQKSASFADIIAKAEESRAKFKVIIKADVTGSLEAILTNLPENLLVVSAGVGEVTQADITTAKVAQAPILAFNVRVDKAANSQADKEGVIIKKYNVIYDLLSDIEDVVVGFEKAKQELKITGRAKIVASFDIEGKKIAGVMVTHGKLKNGDNIVVKRADGSSMETKIVSLKRFKKNIESVSNGQDCGLGIDPALDFKEGDIIESLG